MSISTMYPAMPGSPKTTLTADITADSTSLTVDNGNQLPDAPNILVIGDDETAEVISYNSKSGNAISGLIRALGGTVASAWSTGTEVARNFTSFDHDRFMENIQDLAANKADTDHNHDSRYYTESEVDALFAGVKIGVLRPASATTSDTFSITASASHILFALGGRTDLSGLYLVTSSSGGAPACVVLATPASATTGITVDVSTRYQVTFNHDTSRQITYFDIALSGGLLELI